MHPQIIQPPPQQLEQRQSRRYAPCLAHNEEGSLRLITHVKVEPAHNSDADALIPAIESTEEQNLKPKELTADSLYGSDDNHEKAKEHGVELIAPTMGSTNPDRLSLSDFELSEKGQITACPRGTARQP